jgi:8-amino-7-oxononanoate synthase
VYTFGKAMGCHGAVVCGSQVLIDYLVNYARSFIYTTAFPFEQLVTVQVVHEFCATADQERKQALDLVQYFKRKVQTNKWIPSAALLESDSPIQGVVFEGNHEVLHAAKEMIAMGIRVIPIRSPTVPKGSERFRIVIHANNSEQEIDALITALEAMFRARQSATKPSKL